MFELLKSTSQILSDIHVKWCFCGGWAIDLFMGTETRPHKDLDIMIFKEDLARTIAYMRNKGWRVEVPTRKGFIPVDEESFESLDFENLWCMNEAYPTDYLRVDDKSSYNFYHYDREVQEEFDFVEIVLNASEDNDFIYHKNPEIRRPLDLAIFEHDGMPYLAPEIVLLYKSKYLSEDNQKDFNAVLAKLTQEQKSWLKQALICEYGNDHPWVERLSE